MGETRWHKLEDQKNDTEQSCRLEAPDAFSGLCFLSCVRALRVGRCTTGVCEKKNVRPICLVFWDVLGVTLESPVNRVEDENRNGEHHL